MHLEEMKLSPTHTEEEGYGSSDDKELEVNPGSTKGGELKRPDLKGSFRCSICSKVFCHSSSLSRHRMQAHFKNYKCTVCRKDISSSESLRTHMFKQHHISRMYMCRCCNWAFPDKSLLHIHLQTQNPNGVINRSCDPFQLIRSPILSLPTPPSTENPPSIPVFPVPTALESPVVSQTPAWLASLPKPIPTTTPIFPTELVKPKEEESCTAQSPTCSFKSDFSAFHQLSSDRHLLSSPLTDSASPSSSSSSRISPRQECFECQILRTKLTITSNKCKFFESRVGTLSQESLEANAQMNGLEQTLMRLRMEAHLLREHNQLFQQKLLECQNLAVKFLQSEKSSDSSEVTSFLRLLINNTILTTAH